MTLERSTQDTVEHTIFSKIHNKQYTMAGEALICHGQLFEDFGHTANTPASRAVLDGVHVALQDSDTATWELFEEIAVTRQRVPKDLVSISITPTQWKQY